MDAPAALYTATWPEMHSPVARRLSGAALGTLFTLVVLAAVVIGIRRAGGELREPLPAGALAVLAVGLALAALVFRQFASRWYGQQQLSMRYALWAAPTLVLALWSIDVLLPGTSAVGWGVFLAVLLVEEGWSWGRVAPRSSRAKSLMLQSDEGDTGLAIRDLPDEGPVGTLEDNDAAESSEVDETASQWLVRRREPNGGETIEGWIRVPFESGQRHANAHLALCPALANVPACYAEPSDGPPCQVKVGQVLPYGVRLEIKLDETVQELCDVLVEFSIQARES